MTDATLRSQTAKELAQIARQNGVVGWHSMRKEELINTLVRLARKRALISNGARNSVADNKTSSRKIKSVHRSNKNNRAPNPRIRHQIDQLQRKLATVRNLAAEKNSPSTREVKQDRLAVLVRDPYWLHAFWELSQQCIDRAKAAMGQRWHTAQPILRVYQIQEAGSSLHEKDIPIHGGVCNWYVDVQEPPCQFRMEIGYLAKDGSFYCLARSNSVQTPPAGISDAVDDNWTDVAEDADRIYAMSGGYSHRGTSRELQELLEERLRRPLGSPMTTRYGSGATTLSQTDETMPFAVDAEIIVYGVTDRNAHVTLKGEPVQLRADGTFAVRLSLPDRRQVIPVVASSCDGVEQQTIILAVERNTKLMEPVIRDITVK